MADRKKDDSIIDLTEIVEEGPGPAPGGWMTPPPPPAKEAKVPPPPEVKPPEPPKIPRREGPLAENHFSEIPESPLKKFLMAEDEPTSQFTFPPPQPPERPPKIGPSIPEPTRPAPPGPKFSPLAGPHSPEVSRPAPEPPRLVPEPPPLAPEPRRPALPNVDAEMRALREAMLNRVEKWMAQEGVQVLERVAREIFPRKAEEIIRQEIEKLKKEAEESE